MEIKLVQNKGIEVLEKCGFCMGWEYPRGGLSGGLLLGWQPNLNLSIQYSSKHLIHADLLDHKGIKKLSIKAKCKKSNHIQSKLKASPTEAGKFSLRW
ncbi:hypothetical protein CMV_019266 [Castanea mollissima]|uniref:Uncharacterized protein n=1 Tax=Castanea mollissima TaxID=60419 RepID=A0A8J4R1H5_9ROSI|nr:hypothetical protein CMV_019266 [Castanea mollissima]